MLPALLHSGEHESRNRNTKPKREISYLIISNNKKGEGSDFKSAGEGLD